MENITLSDIAAWIGCITGFSSLIMCFRQIWHERFALKIYLDENENIYFSKLKSFPLLCTDLQGLLYARFENRSATPITIYSLNVWIDGVAVSIQPFEEKCIELNTYQHPNGSTEFFEISMDNQITLPIRLDAYDAISGFMFIPFYPFTEKISQLVKVQVETTKGKRTRFSRIWINKQIVDDGDGPYFL